RRADPGEVGALVLRRAHGVSGHQTALSCAGSGGGARPGRRPRAVTDGVAAITHIVYAFRHSARATMPARSMMTHTLDPASQPFPPLPARPGTTISVTLAYASRAVLPGRRPAAPSYFLKPCSSVARPGGTLERPAGTELLAFEGEIALVIGTPARHVGLEDAW